MPRVHKLHLLDGEINALRKAAAQVPALRFGDWTPYELECLERAKGAIELELYGTQPIPITSGKRSAVVPVRDGSITRT